jgi:hypothetical protein
MLRDDLAEVGLARAAVSAGAARGNEAQRDMVSGRDVPDCGADGLDDARTLVTHHGGPLAGAAEVAVRMADVRMAHPDGGDPDEHFIRLRWIELDVLDLDGLAWVA